MLLAFSDSFSQSPRFYLADGNTFAVDFLLGARSHGARSHVVRVKALSLACLVSFAVLDTKIVSAHLSYTIASVEFTFAVVRAAHAIIMQLVATSKAAVVEVTSLFVHSSTISSAHANFLNCLLFSLDSL